MCRVSFVCLIFLRARRRTSTLVRISSTSRGHRVEYASLVLNDEGLPRVCLYWERRRQKMMAVGGDRISVPEVQLALLGTPKNKHKNTRRLAFPVIAAVTND